MKKIVRLTESDLIRIVKRVISEQEEMPELFFDTSDEGGEFARRPTEKERMMAEAFKQEIKEKLLSGGSDWSVDNKHPHIKLLIKGVRRVCDKFESYLSSKKL
jgi:F420-0:gamma-glutamyl ligase